MNQSPKKKKKKVELQKQPSRHLEEALEMGKKLTLVITSQYLLLKETYCST